MRPPRLALLAGLLLTAPTPLDAASNDVRATPPTAPACLPEGTVDCVALPAVESNARGERARVSVARYAVPPAEVERRYRAWAADNHWRVTDHTWAEQIELRLHRDETAPTTVRIHPASEGGAQITLTTTAPALPHLPSWLPRCAGCQPAHLFAEGDQLLAILVGAGSPLYGAARTDYAFRAAGWTRSATTAPEARDRHSRRYTRRSSICVALIDGDAIPGRFRVSITCQRQDR